jgi:hypothetical protein
MRHLRDFVLSEGSRYQQLLPASDEVHPRKAPGSRDDGLDGWTFMMRTAEADFALLYFENGAVRASIAGLSPVTTYRWTWFDTRKGGQLTAATLMTDRAGNLATPRFPNNADRTTADWAAKLQRIRRSEVTRRR